MFAGNNNGSVKVACFRPIIAVGLITIVVGAARETAADVVSIEPIKDNTIFDEFDLSNGVGERLFAGRTAIGDTRRALLAFDLELVIPAGSTITSVELTLNMSRTLEDVLTQTVQLHRLLGDWGEGESDADGEEGKGDFAADGDVTWLHSFFPDSLWETPGGEFVETASASADVDQVGRYAWGSTAEMVADTQNWLDDAGQNFGWMLIGPEDTYPTAKRFDSKDHEDPSVHPVLTVEFTPPGAGNANQNDNGDNANQNDSADNGDGDIPPAGPPCFLFPAVALIVVGVCVRLTTG